MSTSRPAEALPSSFRDPSGFVFTHEGTIYRQVNPVYAPHYDQLMGSGLYETLVDKGGLIPHKEVKIPGVDLPGAYRTLRPEQIPFISYPYEWSFSQLRDAALLTLDVQRVALDFDMWLKDATAYNVQMWQGRPVLIDTLSFEQYEEGKPWPAYRQFCQQFFAPLALMAYRDVRLGQLSRIYIDGVPLDLASALLPARTRFRFSTLSHIHFHARTQKAHADDAATDQNKRSFNLSRQRLLGLLDNLRTATENLEWTPENTEWGAYYDETNYSEASFDEKGRLVKAYLEAISPNEVWDLGGNTGTFSRLASDQGIFTVSFDIDPACIENSYRKVRKAGEPNLLPLILDLTNPSPGIGWQHQERHALMARGPVSTVMALALIHHLAISNNVPLDRVAHFLAQLCQHLIIEFVPKTDSQVKRLLTTRTDIFPDYTPEGFEIAFSRYFEIKKATSIPESERILYLMRTL